MAEKYVEQDAVNLRAALASGARQVQYTDGRSVTFNTVEDLKAALAVVEGYLEGGKGGKRVTYASTSRG